MTGPKPGAPAAGGRSCCLSSRGTLELRILPRERGLEIRDPLVAPVRRHDLIAHPHTDGKSEEKDGAIWTTYERPERLRLPWSVEWATLRPEYERPPANSDRALISCLHRAGLDSRNRLTERHGAMRKLIYGMNLTLDGYVAAPGDDLGWSGPSDELFQWWLDQELAIGLLLYGRKLWETMSSYWPTGDQQPGAIPAQIEFARNWRDTPKVVFSSTVDKVDWNTRLVTGDAVAEITRLKAEDGEPMRVGGAALAGAAMRAGLIDEYEIVTHPVLVGGGTPFFTALDSWVNLNLVETRTFPGGVVLTRYETRR